MKESIFPLFDSFLKIELNLPLFPCRHTNETLKNVAEYLCSNLLWTECLCLPSNHMLKPKPPM